MRRTYRCLPAALLTACVAAGLLASCRPEAPEGPDVELEWSVAPEPPQVGPARVAFVLKDSAGQPLEGVQARLEANMTHPGMQAVYADAEEVAPGRYEAPITFTMGGAWFVIVDGTLADGRRFTRQFDVPHVRGER